MRARIRYSLLTLFLTVYGSATEADDRDLARRLERPVEAMARESGVECVLVAVQGRLIQERSVGGDGCREPHNIQSASKSILSPLTGIALAEGRLGGLDQTLDELLPEASRALEPEKRSIRLRDLLSMQAGLASTSGQHYGAWVSQRDWVEAALARPLRHPPGTTFTYSTGNTHLLVAALTRAVQRDLLAWADDVLLAPLGITVDAWDRSPEGLRFGGNNFAITARELLRFGRLHLDRGRHRGRQLVPVAWIDASWQVHSEGWPDRYGAYGYLWWLRPEADPPAAMAVGYGGQFLYLVRELDLAVVVTATNQGKGAEWDRRILRTIETGIVPAVAAGRAARTDPA